MKLVLEIRNATEAASAATWVRALSDAFRLINGEITIPVPADPPETVTAPKTNGHGGARAGAGGARPGAGRPKKVKQAVATVPEQLDLLDAIAAAKQAAEPVATDRERLKAIAIDRGVTWVRGVLAEKGAAKLSELTDAQIRELLDAA